MKINRYLFKKDGYVQEEDIDFSHETFDPYHIRKINKAHVVITGNDYDEILLLNLKISYEVIGVCSYSLEDVIYKSNISTSLSFSFEEEDEEIIHIDNPIFDIDQYVLGLIIADVPLRLIKKGAKLPSSGEGYRVITEDQYNEEQKNKTDPRWAALDNIDIDEN